MGMTVRDTTMLYLSQMMGKPVVDTQGEKIGTISDLAISTGEVFPRITSLAFQGPGKVPFMISWRKYVDTFDEDGITLNAEAHDIRFSYLQPDEVLLARDLLNRQIVDTQGLKVVRVNDLKLSVSGSQLRLLADGRVLANIAMILAGAASTYVFYTYLAPILADVVGLDAAGTSLALLLFGAACVGSNLLSGWVAGRFGLRALPVAFAVHAALLALLAVSLPAGAVGIANILAVGLLMYVMNSTVQMLFQNVARADYPSALTFSASLHPMSFNAGIALGSFAGGLVVNAGGLLATGPVGALFALAAAALALALVRMTARRSGEIAAEAARTAATAREPR